ncbi:MAG TPA: low specificity L-threonine aldolase [Gemmatimonadales bacterium]|nr:low specificity L-threonine aldolase [Gemmatimonadales bacterium]
MTRSFASDNNAGAHPEVLAALARVNDGHVRAYGDDPFTASAIAKLREHLGERAEIFFVFGGTGANVLGLHALMRPHEAVICSNFAHIQVDECGAPERFIGGKLLGVAAPDGKVTPDAVVSRLVGIGSEHHSQPRVVSVSQATEYGTVYTPDELRALADTAHAHGLFLHVDGARIANAAASLGVPLRAITADAGVDVMSLGGTKNGLVGGEAVVFFDPRRAADFRYMRKQAMQLPSKMRFIAAQFDALFTDELWLRSARHANAMAQRLAARVRSVPGVTITQRVDANAVFAILPRQVIPALQEECFFYVWDEGRSEVRWMASWDTTEEDVDAFASTIARATGSPRQASSTS